MQLPKMKVDVFLSPEDLNRVAKHVETHELKNVSQGIQHIMLEWRRFTVIINKLEDAATLKRQDDALKVVKKDGKKKKIKRK